MRVRVTTSFIVAMAILLTIVIATAYPTGSMSCSDIGDFAATVVADRAKGATLNDALAKVNERKRTQSNAKT